MTMTSSNHDSPATDTSSDDHSDNVTITTRGTRRRRPSRRWFKRRWLRVLRPGNLLRASAVILLPAAFIHVSLMNDVLGPRENEAASFYTDPIEPAVSASLAENQENVVQKNVIDDELTTHVVPEGGSLWRTGMQFIDDESLLDALIDNLAERGMDVGNVRAGTQFQVLNLGSEGLIVVIEADGNTYQSRVYEDEVVTSRRRAAADEVSMLNAAFIDQ